MGRRYRKSSNSIASIVADVVQIASRSSWWGALLTGGISYVFISLLLGGYIEGQIAAQAGDKFFAIAEIRLGYMANACDWVGLACLVAGLFFAVRNYFMLDQAQRAEQGLVTFLSKIAGRSLD